jgi:hypothetical protein
LEQEIKKEPLDASYLDTTLQARLDSIVTNSYEAICSNREAIILFA